MFLTDVFLIEQLTVLNEGNKGNGPMRVRGIFQRADEANNNGRIYPKTILEGQVKKLQDKICDRTLCGELDHPQNDSVRLSNASHLITKLYMQGPEVIGEAEILNTPAGMTAKALIEGGVKIGISSRGTGTISENATGAKVVNEDFNMVTFDLVADPSTRAAYPGMCESTESKLISNTMDKFGKEKNFLTMLESRLNESAIDAISSAAATDQEKGKRYLRNAVRGVVGVGAGAVAAGTRAAMHKPDELGSGPGGDRKDSQGRTRGDVVKSAFTRAARAQLPGLAKSTEDRTLRGNKAAEERAKKVKAAKEAKDKENGEGKELEKPTQDPKPKPKATWRSRLRAMVGKSPKKKRTDYSSKDMQRWLGGEGSDDDGPEPESSPEPESIPKPESSSPEPKKKTPKKKTPKKKKRSKLRKRKKRKKR